MVKADEDVSFATGGEYLFNQKKKNYHLGQLQILLDKWVNNFARLNKVMKVINCLRYHRVCLMALSITN